MCWSKTCTTRTTPLYYFTKSWNLSREVACIDGLLLKRYFEFLCQRHKDCLPNIFDLTFFTFFTLFTFQCLGLKLGPSFETRGSAAMARIPAYTDDFFEGAAVQLKGLKRRHVGWTKNNLHEGDVWCMAVYNLYEECWLWMAVNGSDTVLRRDAVRWAWTAGSFRLWVRGIWLLRSSRTQSDHVFLKVTLVAYIQYVYPGSPRPSK